MDADPEQLASTLARCREDPLVTVALDTWWDTIRAELLSFDRATDVLDGPGYIHVFKRVSSSAHWPLPGSQLRKRC